MKYGAAAMAVALAAAWAAAQEGEGRGRIREVRGSVRKVDATVGTIDIRQRGDGGQVDLTFNLSRAAKVTVDGKEGKLGDLAEGMNVLLRISPATDDVQSIAAEGPTLGAALIAVDAGARTLTLGGEGREKSYPLSPDARVMVDGRNAALGDLKEGARVTVKLSVDGKSVVGVTAGRARDGDERREGDRPVVRRDGDREGGERPVVRRDGDREGAERPAVRREGDRPPRRVSVSIARLDANGDGKISPEEWVAGFAQYDLDKDGTISDRELLEAAEREEAAERKVERRPDADRREGDRKPDERKQKDEDED